jgi:hypothetical protein
VNLIGLIAGLAPPLLCGWWLVAAAWPRGGERRVLLLVRVPVAAAVGFAAAGLHYLAWRVTSPAAPGFAYKLVDCLTLPVLALIAARRFGRTGTVSIAPAPATPFRWRSGQTLMLVATLAVVALALLTMAGRAWREALGYWDAWAIWNLKARFMFLGGPEWSAFFSRHVWYAHPDYPLLLPATVARLWTYLGHDPPVVPQLVSVGFSGLMLALVFGGGAALRGVPAGCIGVLIVAGAERVLFYGGSQMADLVLAAYVTGAAGLVALAGRADHGALRLFLLSGMLSGFAACVKNEGLMLALCLLVATAVAGGLIARAAGGLRRPALFVLLGMMPGLLAVAAQKVVFRTDSYMLSDQEASIRDKALDPDRHAMMLRFIAETDFGVSRREVGPFDQTLPNKPMLWLLVLLPIAGGVSLRGRDRFAIVTLGLLSALGFAGYYAAVLVMPYDLHGNLHFGFDRVQLHIYPTLVMAIILLTRRLPGSAPTMTPTP